MGGMTRRVLLTMLLAAGALGAVTACSVKNDAPPAADGAADAIPAPPDVAAPPADALRTASGLASKVLQVGLGSVHPTLNSWVKVHYTGWTAGGVMFDSSVQRGEPIDFQLTNVIPGWTEGVQLMVAGEKRRFWIPAKLAYGDVIPGQPAYDPATQQPPRGPLVFDIEVLAIR